MEQQQTIQEEIREVLIAERKDLIVTISDVSQRLVLLMKWKKDLDKKLGIMELTKDVVH